MIDWMASCEERSIILAFGVLYALFVNSEVDDISDLGNNCESIFESNTHSQRPSDIHHIFDQVNRVRRLEIETVRVGLKFVSFLSEELLNDLKF